MRQTSGEHPPPSSSLVAVSGSAKNLITDLHQLTAALFTQHLICKLDTQCNISFNRRRCGCQLDPQDRLLMDPMPQYPLEPSFQYSQVKPILSISRMIEPSIKPSSTPFAFTKTLTLQPNHL
ncbi:hypothetical protein AVEN_152780-1 [Araneus ventricosus]|uniref:Uncharacterized protein n=1 Tax=Araneus ventricosus TaxID=182803 RepID=A0A4Y2W011_ARAVE|nr:hypothetical protein AVEN_152780-1 [Araneus ventricosus]